MHSGMVTSASRVEAPVFARPASWRVLSLIVVLTAFGLLREAWIVWSDLRQA